MSQAGKEPQDLYDQEPELRRKINHELDLNSRQKAVLNVVLDYSFLCGKEWANFDGWELLAGLAGLDRTHASTWAKKLQQEGLLSIKQTRGDIRIRFLPSGVFVEPEPKLDPKVLAILAARARRLNALPDGFDPNGQKHLDIKTVEEKLEDELARESRERARSGAGGPTALPLPPADPERTDLVHSGTNVPNRYIGERTDLVRSQPHACPRAPGHVIEPPTEVMSHDSDRGAAERAGSAAGAALPAFRVEWGSLHAELLDQVIEVCEPADVTLKQESDWRARILRNPRAVREAVQETHQRKSEGKLKKPDNPGGFLNVVYLDISGEKKKPKPWEVKKN